MIQPGVGYRYAGGDGMAEGGRRIMVKVDDDVCQACVECLAGEACRGHAFRRFSKEESPFLDMSRCWGCLDCVPACPHGAVIRHQYDL